MIDSLSNIHPMIWLIFGSVAIIMLLALFSKALKFGLKLAVIGAMLLVLIYFLREVGLLPF